MEMQTLVDRFRAERQKNDESLHALRIAKLNLLEKMDTELQCFLARARGSHRVLHVRFCSEEGTEKERLYIFPLSVSISRWRKYSFFCSRKGSSEESLAEHNYDFFEWLRTVNYWCIHL